MIPILHKNPYNKILQKNQILFQGKTPYLELNIQNIFKVQKFRKLKNIAYSILEKNF